MKICFISLMGGSPWGGSEELWTAAAFVALERGHRVMIVTYDWPITPPKILKLREMGAELLHMPRGLRKIHVRILRRLVIAQSVMRSILGRSRIRVYLNPWNSLSLWKPDVLCISQGGSYDIIYQSSLIKFIEGSESPYVLVCQHNVENQAFPRDEERRRASDYFRQARSVVFVAQGNYRAAERQLAEPIPNACVVRNPVNLIDLGSVRWPDSQTPSLACVARLEVSFKGQDSLLEVLSGKVWRSRSWRLRFYGEGPDRSYLLKLTQNLGLSDRVQFLGHVSDVREIWSENHLLIMPSRSEGTPLSLVEAMICSRPALVTDVGGNGEWVTDSDNGFLADAPSLRSLGGALERAWTSLDDWEEMGTRARDTALRLIDPDPGLSLLNILTQEHA